MRKKMFSLKNIAMLFMALGMLSSVGCRKQDANENNERIENLEKKVDGLSKLDFDAKLKALEGKLDKAKKDLQDLLDGKSTQANIDAAIVAAKAELQKLIDEKSTQTDIDAAKAELQKLIDGKATQADIDAAIKKAIKAAKEDVVSMTVAKSVFETHVEKVKADLASVNEKIQKLQADGEASGADFDRKLKDLKEEVLGMVVKMTAFNDYKTEQASKLAEFAEKFKAIEADKENSSKEVEALKGMMSNFATTESLNEANLRIAALETFVTDYKTTVLNPALEVLKSEFKGELNASIDQFNKDLSGKTEKLNMELLKFKKAVSINYK